MERRLEGKVAICGRWNSGSRARYLRGARCDGRDRLRDGEDEQRARPVSDGTAGDDRRDG